MSIVTLLVCPRSFRCCLLGISLLSSLLVPADNSLAQTASPQTEQQTSAKQAFNHGLRALQEAQFEDAAEYFQQAKDLDPLLLDARLYLATTCARLYIPNYTAEKNVQMGRKAIEEFKGVLTLDPQNLTAIDGIGSMLFQLAGQPVGPSFDAKVFAESKSYFVEHIRLRPQDPEPYYWIGVIDWTVSQHANVEIRARYNQTAGRKRVPDDDPLPPSVRAQYAREYGPMIEDGIEQLRKALELKPDDDDAMRYLNLLYRRKADAAATIAERQVLEKLADDLVGKASDIKHKRVEAETKPQ